MSNKFTKLDNIFLKEEIINELELSREKELFPEMRQSLQRHTHLQRAQLYATLLLVNELKYLRQQLRADGNK